MFSMPPGKRGKRNDRHSLLQLSMTRRGKALLAVLPLVAAACAGQEMKRARPTLPGTVLLSGERPEVERPYAGGDLCRRCHEDIYVFWKGTAHAGSFTTLAASGEENNPSCLRCHTTGYGEKTGFVDEKGTPGLAAVACETCHGPSGDHALSVYPDLVPTLRRRECSTCEVGRICRTCHTSLRSSSFDLAKALETVSCNGAAGGVK